MSEEARPILDFRYGLDQVKPADFTPADWTVLKRSGKIVAARHASGTERKLPVEWMEAA